LNDAVKALLAETDRVLLDIKYTSDELYRKHVGCTMDAPLAFLDYLNQENIPTTVRQVIIPTLNDNEENILKLKEIANAHPCVDKFELLPFRKICQVKYDKLGIPFRMADLPEPTQDCMQRLNTLL
jgi:pyruvate formate lyase activating enzyme